MRARINALWKFSPDLVMIVSIACFTLVAHQQLTVPDAFTALALFGMRLEQFYDNPEVDPWVSSLRPDTLALPAPDGAKGEVGISHGTFKYHEKDAAGSSSTAAAGTATPVEGEQKFELSDVAVSFPEGKLSLVCGATGSGKTLLFLALLGARVPSARTLDAETGRYDGVAYAAQLQWLQHDSIRNNIIFGSPFEEERYKQVVEACALQADLEMFNAGNETEIGEKGISLSGGQKGALCFTQTVLLDDPLSAVDSHTARHLFRKCIRGPLLKNRTVILITHHISVCLSSADYVVRLSEGRMTLQGHIDELDKGKLTTELVDEDDKAFEANAVDAAEKQLASDGKVDAKDPHKAEHAASAALAPSAYATPRTSTPVLRVAKRSGKLIKEEKHATGGIKWRVYHLPIHLSVSGSMSIRSIAPVLVHAESMSFHLCGKASPKH
ncbi:hypothetical protein JCM10449v2_004072 [Rhodotorula kratochvilovae]